MVPERRRRQLAQLILDGRGRDDREPSCVLPPSVWPARHSGVPVTPLTQHLAEWVNRYMANTSQRSGALPVDWAPGPWVL